MNAIKVVDFYARGTEYEVIIYKTEDCYQAKVFIDESQVGVTYEIDCDFASFGAAEENKIVQCLVKAVCSEIANSYYYFTKRFAVPRTRKVFDTDICLDTSPLPEC